MSYIDDNNEEHAILDDAVITGCFGAALGARLGSVTASEYQAADTVFRATYPMMISELATAASQLAKSPDSSNRATATLWMNTTIPRIKQIAQLVFDGDVSKIQSLIDAVNGLLRGAHAWLGSDMPWTERAVVALRDMLTTAASAAKSMVTEVVKAAGEAAGAGLKSALDNAGTSTQSVITTVALAGTAAFLGYVFLMKK